jgi:hypothetical protein
MLEGKGKVVEWFRQSQVVTEVEFCRMDDSVISALIGNSSVKRLSMIDKLYGENNRSLAWCSQATRALNIYASRHGVKKC